MDLRALKMRSADLVGAFVVSTFVFESQDGSLYPEGTVWRVTGKDKRFKFTLSKWKPSEDKKRPWVQDVVRGVPTSAFEPAKADPVRIVFRRFGSSEMGLVFFHKGKLLIPSDHIINENGQLVLTFDTVIIEDAAPEEDWPPNRATHPGREDGLTFDEPNRTVREMKRLAAVGRGGRRTGSGRPSSKVKPRRRKKT